MTLFVGFFVCLGFYRCWDFKFVFFFPGWGVFFGGIFFLMEASSKPYAPPQSTSLLSSLKKGITFPQGTDTLLYLSCKSATLSLDTRIQPSSRTW